MLYLKNLWTKYISIDDKISDIANNLTLKTCEIEEIKSRVIPEGVVIGKVLEVEKHPNADKLFVVKVDCGDKGIYQIVTGGENIINGKGKFVPVALPNTYLPEIDLKIVGRSMRGVESNGMICSKEELGIVEDIDKHWIWILNDDIDDLSDDMIGKSLKEVFPWLENDILDVDNKTLTHRPDLTGHFGIAVELFAIYNFHNSKKIKYNKIVDIISNIKNTNIYETLENASKISRKIISETDKLNTYILLQIDNVNIKKSTFFTRTIMYDLGLNPKNNWIDFSNIFMYLAGQPIHFFDADKVKGNVIVRNAKDGEEFIDLLDQKHILSSNDIVIADEEKILALAGIIGGKSSAVDENTKNILVEIANFDKTSIRKTGIRLGLRTDAEIRFEKGINPLWSLYSLILFLDEIKYFSKDLGDYNIVGLDWFVKYNYSQKVLTQVDIFDDISKFILGEIRNDFIDKSKNILRYLGFDIENDKLYVPIRRSDDDINIMEDLSEEIARILGYENIDLQSMNSEVKYIPFNDLVDINRNLEEIFVRDLKFDQIETYPWVDENVLDLFEVDKSKLFSLKNPIAPELKYLRNSLIFNFLDVLKKNIHFFDYIKVFDIGKIWIKGTDNCKNDYLCFNEDKVGDNLVEKNVLGFSIYKKRIKNWEDDVVLEAKSYLDIVFKRLDLRGKIEFKQHEGIISREKFHPKKYAIINFNGRNIGWIGQLHPILYDNFKMPLSSEIVFVELYIDLLIELVKQQKKGIKISKYEVLQDQIVYRDLSFVLDVSMEYGKIIESIKKVKGVEDIEVFDIYKGDNIPEDKKSISLKLKIKGENLKTEDISKIMEKAIKEVEKIGGKLRE